MINKQIDSCDQAVASVFDGATIMMGGFGNAGMPGQLIDALRRKAVKNLTIISNGAGTGPFALGALFAEGLAKKLIASYPAPTAAMSPSLDSSKSSTCSTFIDSLFLPYFERLRDDNS